MDVYLVWASELPGTPDGPWREWRDIAPGLALVESGETLSAVYHAVKWQLADDAALIVTPVDRTPKSRGMAAGTTSWLRRRTAPPPTGRAG
jgi:hypothetical protein